MAFRSGREAGHRQAKTGLILAGIVLTVAGAVMTIIGIASFFSSIGDGFHAASGLGSRGPTLPERFWCTFVGLPMLGIGIGLLRMGFLRETTRYVVDELNPVAQDAVNDFARGARPGIAELASAVRASGSGPKPAEERLRQLDDLKRRGLVNGDEYDRERRRILAEI